MFSIEANERECSNDDRRQIVRNRRERECEGVVMGRRADEGTKGEAARGVISSTVVVAVAAAAGRKRPRSEQVPRSPLFHSRVPTIIS